MRESKANDEETLKCVEEAIGLRIIGNGGHAQVVRDVLERMDKVFDGSHCFIAVGDNAARKREAAAHPDFIYPVLVDPSAIVSRSARIGEGTIIMAGVVVQAEAFIGRHVILNTGCSCDHGCVIEDYAHIAPGAHLCGDVCVGEGALVGVGSCAVPGASVAEWSLVKAGSIIK